MDKLKTELKIYTHDLVRKNLVAELREHLLMSKIAREEAIDEFLDQHTGGFQVCGSQFGTWIFMEGSLIEDDKIEEQQYFHSQSIAFLAKTLYRYEWYAILASDKPTGLAWYRSLPYATMGSLSIERDYINYNIDFSKVDWDYLHLKGD